MPEYASDTLDLTLSSFWQWDIVSCEEETKEVNTGIPLDSLLQRYEVQPLVSRKSMFHGHMLQVEHRDTLSRAGAGEPVWVFVVLVMLSGLLCLYYKMRKLKPLALMKAAVDGRALDRLVRDCNLNRGVVMLPMGMLLVLAATLPVVRRVAPEAEWWVYVAAATATGLLYVVRNGLMRFLGNVFERRHEVARLITSNYVYHLLEASVLTLGLFLHFYLPLAGTVVLWVLGGLLLVGMVMRMVRSTKIIFTQSNGSSFYLFYYLCTVELIPAVVAFKLFIMQ